MEHEARAGRDVPTIVRGRAAHLGAFTLNRRVLLTVALALPVGATGAVAAWALQLPRGHGMPEAIEAIVMRRSRVEPRVAVLKPVSAAVSIGTGGPFGAEGPMPRSTPRWPRSSWPSSCCCSSGGPAASCRL
jgi:H+/Cl- antiporter ClcA